MAPSSVQPAGGPNAGAAPAAAPKPSSVTSPQPTAASLDRTWRLPLIHRCSPTLERPSITHFGCPGRDLSVTVDDRWRRSAGAARRRWEWRHGTAWQCGRCRFKLGCCEGDPQTACDAPITSGAVAGEAGHRSPRTEARLPDDDRCGPPQAARGGGGQGCLVRRRTRRAVRPARPERRRQDDDDQDADHAPAPHLGRGSGARSRRRHRRARPSGSGSATSSAATAGSTNGSRRTTISATSPSSTASRARPSGCGSTRSWSSSA